MGIKAIRCAIVLNGLFAIVVGLTVWGHLTFQIGFFIFNMIIWLALRRALKKAYEKQAIKQQEAIQMKTMTQEQMEDWK